MKNAMRKAASVMVTATMLLLLGLVGPASADGHTVEITGVDFGFDGVPETVPAGTELTFTNASAEEFHEMVVFRVDDDQDASLDEIAEMAAQESDGPPPEWLTFKGVALAMPNEEGSTPEGPIVLDESGRYLLLCFIPVGADPEVIAEAMKSGEEPELEGGPPHVAAGMIAELTVEPTEQGEEDMVAPTEVPSGTGGLVDVGMPGFVIGIMGLGALLIFAGAAVSAQRKRGSS